MSPGMQSVRGDTTALCELVAARLRAGGVRHPVPAAVALATRGAAAVGLTEFARTLGLDTPALAAVEAGDVAWAAIPPALDQAISAVGTLDLLALVDLDNEWASDSIVRRGSA